MQVQHLLAFALQDLPSPDGVELQVPVAIVAQCLPQDEGFDDRILHEDGLLDVGVCCEVVAQGGFEYLGEVVLLAQRDEHRGLLRVVESPSLPFQQNEFPFQIRFHLPIRESFAEGVDCIQEQDVLFAVQVYVGARPGVELQWIA